MFLSKAGKSVMAQKSVLSFRQAYFSSQFTKLDRTLE